MRCGGFTLSSVGGKHQMIRMHPEWVRILLTQTTLTSFHCLYVPESREPSPVLQTVTPKYDYIFLIFNMLYIVITSSETPTQF